MTVYAVIRDYHDSEELQGIFSTRERAEEFIANSSSNYIFEIHEVEIDTPINN